MRAHQKASPAYDLPIVTTMLLSSGQVSNIPETSLFLGELSLDGGLRHTNGILPMVMVAREEGYKSVFVPSADAKEAALVEGIDVMPVNSLTELVSHLREEQQISPVLPDSDGDEADMVSSDGAKGLSGDVDLADIRGQVIISAPGRAGCRVPPKGRRRPVRPGGRLRESAWRPRQRPGR